jgi:hypothetical protein
MEEGKVWNDNDDRIFDVFSFITEGNVINAPVKCPICEENQVHIHMHRYVDTEEKGAIWIWCSTCHVCTHGTLRLPSWWENNRDIVIDRLESHPNYLENIKDLVDEHLNSLRLKKNTTSC